LNYYRRDLRIRKLRLKESSTPASREERARNRITLGNDASIFFNREQSIDDNNTGISFITKEVGKWSGTRELRCMICWLKIEEGEETTSCPHCNSVAHKDHLDQWFTSKGNHNCPRCKREITDTDQ